MRRAVIAVIALAVAEPACSRERGTASERAAEEKGELPGAPPFPPEVARAIEAAVARLPARPRYTNRLITETSPYLRQHAHNPVNWFPWGKEAFETARRLGRPIFLSIGYSTCHWCHVMEDESFEDEEIARKLNSGYVAIKVDREERPDIDSIYSAAVREMGIAGGWPLNVWLTADGKPFFGGTYFPPRDGGRGIERGLATVLDQAAQAHRDKRDQIDASGELIARALAASSSPAGGDRPDPAATQRAVDFYSARFDSYHGGLKVGRGDQAKFPSAMPVRLLLRHHRRTAAPLSLEMALVTLRRMAAGGLRDHIGGGFHRYSTDAKWAIPHFEKMLYDNALLAVSYLEAYQVTRDPELAAVAREILDYLARDMTTTSGGFAAAVDADSPDPRGKRREGWFYTWTPAEVTEVLGAEHARVVNAYFDITDVGNFEGRSVPSTPRPLAEVAAGLGIPAERASEIVAGAVPRLRAARGKRPVPARDDKVIAGWNGLAITAFARAARIFGDDGGGYAQLAERAARSVLDRARGDGRLRRIAGSAGSAGYLDDYAFLIAGLIDLYEATGAPGWLDHAIALDRELAAHHEDPAGGFFLTANDHEQLLAREKPIQDGALPSGNSVAVMNLLRLYELTTRADYLERADRAMAAFGGQVARAPAAHADLLLAAEMRADAVKEIVIVTAGERDQAAPFLRALAAAFVPHHVLVVTRAGPDQAALATRVPLVQDKLPIRGKPTAYVCERQACELPTTDPAVFARQIR